MISFGHLTELCERREGRQGERNRKRYQRKAVKPRNDQRPTFHFFNRKKSAWLVAGRETVSEPLVTMGIRSPGTVVQAELESKLVVCCRKKSEACVGQL